MMNSMQYNYIIRLHSVCERNNEQYGYSNICIMHVYLITDTMMHLLGFFKKTSKLFIENKPS